MKTFSVIILLAITTISISHAQIKVEAVNKEQSVRVGKVTQGFNFVAELEYVKFEGDTLFTLRFKNAEYSNIADIHHMHTVSLNFQGR